MELFGNVKFITPRMLSFKSLGETHTPNQLNKSRLISFFKVNFYLLNV